MKTFITVILTMLACALLLRVVEQSIYERGYAAGVQKLDETLDDVYSYGYEAGMTDQQRMDAEKATGCILYEG